MRIAYEVTIEHIKASARHYYTHSAYMRKRLRWSFSFAALLFR